MKNLTDDERTKEFEKLQKREQDIWKKLEKNLTDKQIGLISELIEINIELEKFCGE